MFLLYRYQQNDHLAPGETISVKLFGLLQPPTQGPAADAPYNLVSYLKQIDIGQTHGEIDYTSATGKRYRTKFTMDHTLDDDSFIIFGGMNPVD